MINGLDLFSGIGGITIALKEWVRPVAYCELDEYAAGVLFSRMLDGSIPRAPIFPDVRRITKEMLPDIDIIYGGFPCQDISNAGLRKGLEGERSGLYAEIVRLSRDVRPRFVFLENVSAITSRGLEQIVSEWNAMGYDCRWTVLSAAAVGAPHIRERWWFLAHTCRQRSEPSGMVNRRFRWQEREDSPNDVSDGEEGIATESSEGVFAPRVCRAGNGIPQRVDRIRSLGNSVVPQCAKEAFKELMGL